MAGFGGITCDYVKGHERPLAEKTNVWTVPGHDSYGIEAVGTRSEPAQIVLVKYGSSAAVDAWYASLVALQGQGGTFETDFARTSALCLFQQISPLQKSVADLEGGARGECVFTVLAV